MDGFSLSHWLMLASTVVFVMLLPAWFFVRIVTKAGFSGWWALLGVVPLINILALWWFAFAAWPNELIQPSVIRIRRAYRDARHSQSSEF